MESAEWAWWLTVLAGLREGYQSQIIAVNPEM
jgi:hypothetical protein